MSAIQSTDKGGPVKLRIFNETKYSDGAIGETELLEIDTDAPRGNFASVHFHYEDIIAIIEAAKSLTDYQMHLERVGDKS
jgi:hypothetical protein